MHCNIKKLKELVESRIIIKESLMMKGGKMKIHSSLQKKKAIKYPYYQSLKTTQ